MIFILLPIVWFLPSFLPHFDLCILQITCYRRDKMSPTSSSFSLSPSSSSSSPISRSPINIQPEENFHHLVKPFLCVSSFKILEICGSNVFPNCKMLCNILVFYAEYFITHLLPMHINVKQVKMSKLEPQLPCRARWSCLAPVWIRCLCKPSLPSPKTLTLYSTNGISTGFSLLSLLLEFTFPMDISSWSIHSTILHTRVL